MAQKGRLEGSDGRMIYRLGDSLLLFLHTSFILFPVIPHLIFEMYLCILYELTLMSCVVTQRANNLQYYTSILYLLTVAMINSVHLDFSTMRKVIGN